MEGVGLDFRCTGGSKQKRWQEDQNKSVDMRDVRIWVVERSDYLKTCIFLAETTTSFELFWTYHNGLNFVKLSQLHIVLYLFGLSRRSASNILTVLLPMEGRTIRVCKCFEWVGSRLWAGLINGEIPVDIRVSKTSYTGRILLSAKKGRWAQFSQ